MKSKKLVFICQAAVIAALYIVLTYVFSAFASGVIQVRVSEALTILPAFTPAAIPGLVIGCLLSNTLTGCVQSEKPMRLKKQPMPSKKLVCFD